MEDVSLDSWSGSATMGCVACGLIGRLPGLLISKIREAGKVRWFSSALTNLRFLRLLCTRKALAIVLQELSMHD